SRFPCSAPPASVACPLSLHDALPISPFRRRVGLRPLPVASQRVLVGRIDPSQPPLTLHLGQDEVLHVLLLRRGPGHLKCDVTGRSEEHTSELQSRENLVCRLLLEKKK